jgi:hypothetical protein
VTGHNGGHTVAAVAARRRNAKAALARVGDVLARMRREKTPVTVAAVSRRAGVSRTFLYSNPEARALLAGAIAGTRVRTAQGLAGQGAGQEATWRERALNAEDALNAAHARSSSNGPASASSWARSATWRPNGPRKPPSASPPRTAPSNSECGSLPLTTGLCTSG